MKYEFVLSKVSDIDKDLHWPITVADKIETINEYFKVFEETDYEFLDQFGGSIDYTITRVGKLSDV